jgi:ribosomal protein S20
MRYTPISGTGQYPFPDHNIDPALKDATSVIASAGSKGIFHKNNAARKVSRLTKLVNGLA